MSARIKPVLEAITARRSVRRFKDEPLPDKETSYHGEKDLLAIGACIQNMLLSAHEQGVGACWLGEILNQRDAMKTFFKRANALQLEAVIALGKPLVYPKKGKRKSLARLMVARK